MEYKFIKQFQRGECKYLVYFRLLFFRFIIYGIYQQRIKVDFK